MSEKCDFCIGGKCVDSADEVPCGWAEGERWNECECATFGTFDEDEAVEVGKMNREDGISVPLEQTGPTGGQTAAAGGGTGDPPPTEAEGPLEDGGARMCDSYRNGRCADDGLLCGFQDGHWEECDCYACTAGDAAPSVSEADSSPIPGGTGEPSDELVVVKIRVDLIDPHPDNPRKSELDVEELAASIATEGIQQPLTVVPHIGGYDGRYTCVIGHRRLAAAKKAGMETVPAFIRGMDRREQLRTMMTENTQRRDLTPLEQADGFKQLMLELPEQTAAAVARETGFSKTTVLRRMKLLELPREAVEAAEERGNVTLADYEELNKIKSPERRAKAAKVLGQPGFGAEVERQKQREREEETLGRLTNKLCEKGAVEVTEEQVKERWDELELVQSIRSWELSYAKIDPLEKGREYLFTANLDSLLIRVYRVKQEKPEEEEPELTDVEKAKAELAAKTDTMKEELLALLTEQEAVDQELLDRRTGFIEGLPCQRHREEIMEAAALLLIRGCWWSDDGLKELGNWLGLEDLKNASNETLLSLIRGNPEKALLYTLYVKAERDAPGWHSTEYFRGERFRKYSQQPKQELLYDILRVLGYQKSGEELLMQGGAHHLQGNAQKIIDQFKADERELKKRING